MAEHQQLDLIFFLYTSSCTEQILILSYTPTRTSKQIVKYVQHMKTEPNYFQSINLFYTTLILQLFFQRTTFLCGVKVLRCESVVSVQLEALESEFVD